MKFIPKGDKRFKHQRQGLRKLIETRGQCALLFDPGLGKTAVALDYLSILALKSEHKIAGTPEVRALVISPKAAVDTWVLQAEKYVHDGVNVWAEALGGSILEKAETLFSRGPAKYSPKKTKRKKDRAQLPHRALNVDKAEMLYTRGSDAPRGPNDLTGKPRLVLLSMNLDTLSSRDRYGSRTVADRVYDAAKAFQPDVVIIDELHKIKGHSSNTSRLAGRIGDLTRRRIGLTGTVMPHSPMDVYAQWRFIEPYAFGTISVRDSQRKKATWAQFTNRYGVFGGWRGQQIVGFQNLDEMQRIMAKNSIVAKKSEALDLPKTTDVKVPVTLSPAEASAYTTMKDSLSASLSSGNIVASNRLTQMLRLRQITAGHLPDDQGNVVEVGSSKVDTIASIANDTLEGEDRIVVFAVFKHEVQALAKKLQKKGTEVAVIDGETDAKKRLDIRQRFGDVAKNPGRMILVAQVKTISVSVNELVTASHAIFASLSQQRDDLIQARDRLNRIGQEKPCTFWYAIARGTIDEVIYESHEKRTNLERAILDHIGSKSE